MTSVLNVRRMGLYSQRGLERVKRALLIFDAGNLKAVTTTNLPTGMMASETCCECGMNH